jgi:hypothetical protein
MDEITGDLRYVERGEIVKIGQFPAFLKTFSCHFLLSLYGQVQVFGINPSTRFPGLPS